ncbi:MAG: hypothetical protein KDC53_24135, partial [Saprospiraceae bacterium]|nr:hypothetical protein [Saprospiraceae bacterium]
MKELKNPDAEIVYLPKDLNLKELIYSFPPKVARYSNNQRRILERLAVILGQIWVRRFYRKEHQSNGFVPLNASVIQDLVKDYRPLMDWALARRIIETDNQYKGGEKSRGYRFTKNYMLETRKFF